MNERLIELMNEANKTAGFTFSMDQAKPVHDLMEKFAELIVNDCANLFPHQFTDEKYQRRIDKTIRKHFGGN